MAYEIRRAHRCIYEIHSTLQDARSRLTITTSAAQAASLADLSAYAGAVSSLSAIDSRHARATHAADKARIDAAIVSAGGFAQIDEAVRGRLLAELLSRVLERGSTHFGLIRSLCEARASLETEVGVYRCAALAMASNPRASIVERRRLRERGRLEDMRTADAEVVRYLLSLGANVNAQSSKTGDSAVGDGSGSGAGPGPNSEGRAQGQRHQDQRADATVRVTVGGASAMASACSHMELGH